MKVLIVTFKNRFITFNVLKCVFPKFPKKNTANLLHCVLPDFTQSLLREVDGKE